MPFLALDDWRWQGLAGSAPQLQSLTISTECVAQPLDDCGFMACFPWTQLTSLDMLHTPLNADIWHEILRQCAHLRVGNFTIQSNPAYINQRVITLLPLRSLTIRFQSEFRARFFDATVFHLVSFPALEALRITARLDRADSTSFVHWMQRQSRHIRSLTLDIQLADDILLDILRDHADLHELTLHFHYGAARQSRFFSRASQDGLLRALRTLIIFGGIDYDTVGGTSSRASFHIGAVSDLVKTATTWAALGPKDNWEFQLFATHEILFAVREGLLQVDSNLAIVSYVIPPPSGLERYHPRYPTTTSIRVRRRYS
ncbi:hypothetical protein B0H16DRAFT_1744808 [Mycena metata]|uniref:Uncharacterized protein n=1 Tax=Mycena metata TaxID=1033252 RepID=A0AAD7MDL0_9AGAR|nr:hypothetical protein B0H16DRAFT_1744808 [Mycena metata]